MAIDGLRALVKVLAEIYPDDGSIQRFARETNLDFSRLMGGSPQNTWSQLLNEALSQDKLAGIVTIALEEHPVHKPLIDAAHEAEVSLPNTGIASVEVERLRATVNSHGRAIKTIWKILHPSPRQRLANVTSLIILAILVVLWIIPVTAAWFLEYPWYALIIGAALAGLALLIRNLPNGT